MPISVLEQKMWRKLREMPRWGLVLLLAVLLALGGCSGTVSTVKKWVGLEKEEDKELAEEITPPEAKEEQVMIDGKPYVRSKNPYWLTYPNQPEYIYVEKGREFVSLQQAMFNSLARAIGKEQQKAAGKSVPPDKVQELVRQEVDRILREQGLGGFVSQARGGEKGPYTGRAVAVIPNPEAPRSAEGLNRTLAMSLAEALRRQKEITVSGDEQIRTGLAKAGITGKMALGPNIRALGDYLGVQGIVLTSVMPPDKGAPGVLALDIYDTFQGNKAQSVVAPAGGGLTPGEVTQFAQQNALRVAGELLSMPWFGRVEFVKDGKVYLSLGQNAGLKVGDQLKVVTPGKEVVNPSTQVVLGYTADIPQGELKVTELLGNTGAVASSVSGGPFKPNDKIKAR
jgi:hypothetical protein